MVFLFSPTATGSVLPHLLLPAVQIFALALPPFPYRATLFVPIILGLILATWANLCSDAVDLRSLMIGQWPWYLGTLEKLSFGLPEQDYWRVDRPRAEAMSMRGLSLTKSKWATALYCSPRLVGWNQQVKGVPEYKAPPSKAEFLVERLKSLAICFVFIDMCNIYNSSYYFKPGVDPMTLTVRGATIWRSLINYAVGLCGAVFPFSYAYIQLSMVCVLLGLGQPKDWPPLFGPFSQTYTLRRFWNTFWHQTARHFLVSYSRDLKKFCGIEKGTWLSSYSELYFCFLLSGLFHGISTYAMPYAPNFDFHTRFTMWFNFMFFQAFAIHFEDLVIWTYKRTIGNEDLKDKSSHESVRAWQMIVGYLWVYTWWYWIDPWTMDPLIRLGITATNPLPFSVLGPILRLTGLDIFLK